MKIIELGYSGVGKTTYMASMYAALQEKVQGFSLRADSSDHQQLIFLANKIKNGGYPLGTERREEYDFTLRHNNRNILSFVYIDYRGGDTNRSTKESKDASILQNDLKEADGIMIFFDCCTLANENSQTNNLNREVRRITALVTNALSDLAKPISLAIILTKSDLIAEFEVSHLAPIQNLIRIIEASPLITGAIIPIVCGQEPMNIDIPLLFALHIGVGNQVQSLNQEIKQAEELAEYYEKRRKRFLIGGIEGIFDKISGNPTNKERAKWSLEKAKEKRKELQPIVWPANSLNFYIRRLPLLKTGTPMTRYIRKLNQLRTKTSLLDRIVAFIIGIVNFFINR